MATTVFKHIQQIAELLKKLSKVSAEIILPGSETADTQQGKFLRSIELNEKELAAKFGVTPTTPSFQVLKSTLLRRLLNSVFLVDLRKDGKFSDYAVAKNETEKYLFIAKTLSFLSLREAAEFISKRELPVAERYELSSPVVEFLSILMNGAYLASNARALKEYRSKQDYWLKVYQSEVDLTGRFSEFMILFARRGGENPKVKDKLLTLSYDAADVFRRFPTFQLGLIHYRLRATAHQAGGEYTKAVDVCKEAETFIRSKEGFSRKMRLAEFASKRLTCYAHLRKREQGELAYKVCEAAYPIGSYNWFVIMESYFLLQTALLDFVRAREIYKQVTNNSCFDTLEIFIRERWTLYDYYLHFAEGQLSSSTKLKHKGKATHRDFLDWYPNYVSDKEGYNVSVLILYILYLIEKRDWEALEKRINGLIEYKNTHFKGTSRQADIFIQLLEGAVDAGCKLKPTIERTASLCEELKSADEGPALEGIQILPFTWLWERVLANLDRD